MLQLLSPSTHAESPSLFSFESSKQNAVRGASTVLIVEDDDDLRCVMEATLTMMGYCVVACADARQASTAYRSRGGIDVLLTDFEMPGRSGVELARELTSTCPTVPVMIITGTVLSLEIMSETQSRGWIYVSKPCNLSSLRATLDRLVEQRTYCV